ncbi:uncharacterized protein [Rutidosis leptorrhynchoides]|uniref:uncharacterized protein isoform X4 n=1 Tax=Rutidosis leptorrhynchoides TaxID=125765 RepID=UPI003A98FF7A
MQLLFGIIMSPIRKSVKCVEAASPCGIDGASGPASSSSSTAKNNRIRKSSVTHCSNVVGFVGRDIRNKDPVASASDVSMVDPAISSAFSLPYSLSPAITSEDTFVVVFSTYGYAWL